MATEVHEARSSGVSDARVLPGIVPPSIAPASAPGVPTTVATGMARIMAKFGPMTSLARRLSESLVLTGLARASAAALALITTTFFLLSSFTFSYWNIVRNANVLWVAQLVHAYPVVYWMVFLLNAITLLPAFSRRFARWAIEVVLLALGTVGLLITRVYPLSDLPLSSSNIAWSVALTLPLFCFGVHDIAMFKARSLWTRRPTTTRLPLRTAFVVGMTVGVWYFVLAWLRSGDSPAHRASILPVLAVTMLLHGCMFAGLVAGFGLIRSLMQRAQLSGFTRWVISLAVIWMLASLVLRKLVTPALSFNNLRADAWALAYPVAFVVMLAGWQVRRGALLKQSVPEQTESIISELVPRGHLWTLFCGACALLLAFAVPFLIARVDWNFLFERLSAVAVWVLAFAVAWRTRARAETSSSSVWKPAAIGAAMAICCIALARAPQIWHEFGLKSVSESNAAYSGMDASLQAAQILFRPIVRDNDATGLFAYVRRNSMIAEPVRPPKLGLIESLSPTPGMKPDIYVLVVDCMRRDYLSPYNPKVGFTPHIAAFARESFVFQHAYTNYGGTALSEPAIWAGEMMPSVLSPPSPFAEMNALEQLTTVDGYHRLLLRDMVLNGVLRELPTDTLLTSTGPGHIGFDIRDEAPEILGCAQAESSDPLFVYAQPQNLHPITLHEVATQREKPEGSYPGFNARYADELRKVDQAFGELIDGLKARGKYDNSIVILTADHGDWLGEYGRWGHGQFLLGPILEVPLLIHLPPALAGQTYTDTNQTVFLTDIAPSLLYLRGHRDLRRGEFFGRPLFTDHAEEQKDYFQRYHLFMSSYAPVFGVLDEQTQQLYMADAIDDNQGLYNFGEDPYGLDNIIDRASQKKFEQLTRDSVERLHALYGYSAPRP